MQLKKKFSTDTYGIICILLSCFFYALLNCLSKKVTSGVHPITMVFYRNLFALITILPFVVPKLVHFKKEQAFNKMNFARGITGFTSMSFWFLAIREAPVTDVVSISFLTPIFASIMAVFFLKEKLSWEKIAALLVGFAGTYVILRPDSNGLGIYVFYTLCASILWAASTIMVKKLTFSQDPITIVFYMSLIIIPISLPWLVFNWYVPTLEETSELFIIAVLSNIAQVLMAESYKSTKLINVMPFDFFRLLFTSIIAFIFFTEVLKINTFLGSLLIILGGFISVKEGLIPNLRLNSTRREERSVYKYSSDKLTK